MSVFPSDEDREAEIARRIEDQARDSAQRAATAASDAEEALGAVIAEARELREKMTSGAVSPDDARRALAGLRQCQRNVAARVPSVRLAYDRAVKTIEDPAARVAELTSKFQGLQQ
jgi:hypothetical protein